MIFREFAGTDQNLINKQKKLKNVLINNFKPSASKR
jgi:hypothetical protein